VKEFFFFTNVQGLVILYLQFVQVWCPIRAVVGNEVEFRSCDHIWNQKGTCMVSYYVVVDLNVGGLVIIYYLKCTCMVSYACHCWLECYSIIY